MISYEGLFFEGDTIELIHMLEEKQLPRVNDEIHCTFKYHPNNNEIFNSIVGKTFDVYLTGYANDELNSGFMIQLPDELMEFYINYHEDNPTRLKPPHITASLAEEAKASRTKDLDFKPLPTPIKITGRFGYWIKDGTKEYISYEPYLVNKAEKITKEY